MSLAELALRLSISFFTLLILARIMGRKEISQMTFFNFISAISIGTIGASLAIDSTLTIRNGLLALVGWSAFTLLLGILNIKSKPIRKAIVGDPLIVIRKGQIMEGALQQARLDINSLSALLRKKNVFSFANIDYAIFETDGSLSVMKKEEKQPVTKSDMNIVQTNSKNISIPIAVISDGEVNNDNLRLLNLNKDWLDEQLQTAGIESVSKVFYAEIQKDGSLYIDPVDDIIH